MLPVAILALVLGSPGRPDADDGISGFRNPPAPLDMAGEAMGGAAGPFYPSSLRTADGRPVPQHLFLKPESCGQAGCHADAVREWQSSSHALSSFASPWYRRSFAAIQSERGVAAARWCAGCHAPTLVASGGLAQPLPPEDTSVAARAGVTCAACHLISAVGSTMGQAGFTLAVPPAHRQLLSDDPRERAAVLSRIRTRPEEHRAAYSQPFLRGPQSAAYCSTCHKSHLDVPVNGLHWLREMNDYDSWQASSVSGFGARSYYVPAQAATCADCHMPRVRSTDAGSRGGFIHSHRFATANTALPALRGDREQLAAVEDYLRGKVTVDIFAMTEPGAAAPPGAPARPVEVFAPLDRLPATVRRGESRRIDVLVRSHAVGHDFPGGKADMHDCWVELKAVDDRGRVIFWSGGASDRGAVDPSAHLFRWALVDGQGRTIDRHDVWNAREEVYAREVLPNTADIVQYRLDVPADAGARIRLTARLYYRKFAWAFTRWVFAGAPAVPPQPPLVVSEDALTLQVVDPGAPLPDMSRPALQAAADRDRFYDYAIGLYLHRDLSGAERAAQRVTEIAPRSGDGWANLGQIALAANDLAKARTYLDRALAVAPASTRAQYLSGQLESAAGNDARALDLLRPLAARFPEDRILLDALASVLTHQGHPEAARDLYERMLLIDPEFRPAHQSLVDIYRRLGDPERSALHQKLADRFGPLGQQIVDDAWFAAHPDDHRERQIRHEHPGAPLAPR